MTTAQERPPLPQQAREWVRWWAGYIAASPFYAVADFGLGAERIGRRIVTWSERASR